MSGLIEVARMKQRLDDTFSRVRKIEYDPQLQSDFAKYLCVLVSGYIETAISQLLQEHARRAGARTLQNFVENKTRRITNANADKIAQLMGSFDPKWREEIRAYLNGERSHAINSIIGNRHQIAHGRDSGITYASVHLWYQQANQLVDRVEKICLEEGAA